MFIMKLNRLQMELDILYYVCYELETSLEKKQKVYSNSINGYKMKGNEELIFTDDSILIKETLDYPTAVMHKGEKALMHKLADIVTKNGGDILEIGFGMHLSADYIQSNPAVTSHTIIEVHPEIYKSALDWAKDKPNTKVFLGDWVDIIPTISKKFHGILHDTHLDENLHKFLDFAKLVSKVDCIVGFFDYPFMDTRLNGVRHSLTEEEYESLPYKDSIGFISNQFELKYTTFNGVNFYKGSKNSKLI